MNRGTIFWVLMLFWLIFGLFAYLGSGAYVRYGMAGNDLLTFILFTLLGWKVFGPAIKGD